MKRGIIWNINAEYSLYPVMDCRIEGYKVWGQGKSPKERE
jgi:hypothetical protein